MKAERLYDKEFEKFILLSQLTNCNSFVRSQTHKRAKFWFSRPLRYGQGTERGEVIDRRFRGESLDRPEAVGTSAWIPGTQHATSGFGPKASCFLNPMGPVSGFVPLANASLPVITGFGMATDDMQMASAFPFPQQELPPLQNGRGGGRGVRGHGAPRGAIGGRGRARTNRARGGGSSGGRGRQDFVVHAAAAPENFQFKAAKKKRGSSSGPVSPEFAARASNRGKKKGRGRSR
jgi:hypothetical protein